jgi:hypothetical protein
MRTTGSGFLIIFLLLSAIALSSHRGRAEGTTTPDAAGSGDSFVPDLAKGAVASSFHQLTCLNSCGVLTICSNERAFDKSARKICEKLDDYNIPVRSEPIQALEGTNGKLTKIIFRSGPHLPRAGYSSRPAAIRHLIFRSVVAASGMPRVAS